MFLLLLYLLFINFFIGRFFGYLLGRKGFISFICLNFLIIYVVCGYYLALFFKSSHILIDINLFSWLQFYNLEISCNFLLDSLSLMMTTMVVLVSGLVHVYSIEYMSMDPHLIRFLAYLSLFTMFMFLLINSGNFIILFLGWEGVGLSSYLLISFWTTRLVASKSGLKALVMNRIADFFFLLAICFLLKYFQTVDFLLLFSLVPYFTKTFVYIFGVKIVVIDLIAILLFIGVCGKSAQFGLHTWLPDAMEGPTPVSALIHAATMVTAGVFLLIRCSFFFCFAVLTLKIVLLVGALTLVVSGFIAVAQNDIKKIIAYSTCSQLGYMVLTCSILNFTGSFFHLLNHAFFKALLFLSAGAIIHLMNGEQDIRKMGNLIKIVPFYYICFIIASLSLAGFFFLSGFYSKESIIHFLVIFSGSSSLSSLLFVYWLSIVGIFLTVLYSFKLIYYVFYNTATYSFVFFKNFNQKIATLFFVVFSVLLILSCWTGYGLKNLFFNSLFFANSISGISVSGHEFEFLPFYIKILPICFSLISFLFVVMLFPILNNFFFKYKFLYFFLNKKLFVDSLYNKIGIQWLWVSFMLFKVCDKGLLELVGPRGIYLSLEVFSSKIDSVHRPQKFLLILYFMIISFAGFLIILSWI